MQKTLIKIIIACVVGMLIGYWLTPTKITTKKIEIEKIENIELIKKLKKKVSSLEKKVKKVKIKTHTIIVENVDGTKKTEINQVTEKQENIVKNIKEKYDSELKKYKQLVEKLKEDKKEVVNPKNLRIEAGININRSYYIHAQYDLFGSFFVGSHINIIKNNTFGIGIGIKL